MAVYFLQAEIGGPIKIGCTAEPLRRLAALAAWSPFPLVLLAVGEGGRAEEGALHKRFAAQRSHGEWFTPSAELLALIDETRKTSRVPVGGILVDMSWRVGSACDWQSNLRAVMARAGCTHKVVADGLGVNTQTVATWVTRGVPAWRIGDVLRFFADRGLHLMPQDLFKPRSLRDAA